MILYSFFRSSSAYRCRIALNLKGLSYDIVPTHIRKGDTKTDAYTEMNPQQLVPTLQDGDVTVTQSLAICEWLDETHPEPPILPRDPALRARVRAFALAIACEIHPLQNLRTLQYLQNELGLDEAAKEDWLKRWIGGGLEACERMLAARDHGGDFCFGEAPTLADICLVPQVFSAERFGIDMSGMPRLRDAAGACNALPAFQEAHPSRQPDAEA